MTACAGLARRHGFSAKDRRRWTHICRSTKLHLLRVPLAGWERIPLAPRLHTVLLAEGDGRGGDGRCVMAFDFLPADPTNPSVIARLLLSASVPGEMRMRELGGVPRQHCDSLSPSPLDFANVVDAAAEFNRSYDGELNLYRNKTCSTYCSKLALHLQA